MFMDMPKPKTPAEERKDQQTAAMLTKAERAAVDAFAKRFGMTRSQAARYLMLRGLEAEGQPFTPLEGD